MIIPDSKTSARLIDDLDEDPLSVPSPTRSHDPPQCLCGAAVTADHLPPVLLRNAQLEYHGLLVFLVLTHFYLVGPVDERLREELEQLLQPIPFALSSFLTVAVG